MGPFAFFPYSYLHFLRDSIISFTIVCSRMLSSRCLLNKNSNFNNLTYCQRRTATPISQRLVPIEDLLSKENYYTHITATCSHRRPAVSGELLHPSHSDLYPSKALSSKENCHTHITATCSHWRSIEKGELIHPSHSDLWLWITYCPRITATPISQQLVAIEDLLSKENCYTHLTATCGHG